MKRLTRSILLAVMACLALVSPAQDSGEEAQEWYLDEVVNREFVERNDFEHYYLPSAADVAQQRVKGEVTYFLNSPTGLNTQKVRALIDRIMASYDDVTAVGDWHTTTSIYWKEFRFEKNKFRFTIKRKALDDGSYYVSVVESSNYYKSLGKGKKSASQVQEKKQTEKPVKRKTRDRRAITLDDVEAAEGGNPVVDAETDASGDVDTEPVMSEQQRRRAAREREQAAKEEERLAKRREQEQRREEAKAQKEAEKQKKAEEKQKKEEEKRLKKEEEQRQREQARLEREQARQEQAAARQQASAPQPVASKYHCNDVALWLSEKYDFTQTGGDGTSTCSMFSTAVKDVEMAKLAIKNALKNSNARMAVPWRLNSETGKVETGYTVDGHVLVFAIGKNDEGSITLDVTEVSAEQFEQFKQSLNSPQ